ncbi:hypothetical protein MTBBW1_1200010 [Desulfamplus magnetovallimortis]|uniref:Uncharacterized protein n=1 Tax=Desulfamplus magnetovallimortis TaxID=1246637 RepID=A0A1W1H6C3_9BACT|nr:hypothetical protein [Desulfamplus magnetovallimortis]SLM27935.1 hypothetical protein MTBBW1_1200010 [Desulfamplus magnetovallimortis]
MLELTSSQRARAAIREFKTITDSLAIRGFYRPSGKFGKALENCLKELSPEIYGTMNDSRVVELKGLEYVIDRLPQGIEQATKIILTDEDQFEETPFTVIEPLKRRRISYRINNNELCFIISRGISEIHDIITHMTFLNIEAKKIFRKMHDDYGEVRSEWLQLEKLIHLNRPLSEGELDSALWNMSIILGRPYHETRETYEYLEKNRNEKQSNSGLFSFIYHLAKRIETDYKSRDDALVIYFTPSLMNIIGHQKYGKLWASRIDRELKDLKLDKRPIHIISANMHSVINLIYGYAALNEDGNRVFGSSESPSTSNQTNSADTSESPYNTKQTNGTNISESSSKAKQTNSTDASELSSQLKQTNGADASKSSFNANQTNNSDTPESSYATQQMNRVGAKMELYAFFSLLRDKKDTIIDFATTRGLYLLPDESGANIDCQIIDTSKISSISLHPEIAKELDIEAIDALPDLEKPVLLVIDYAFGAQAFEVMEQLLKPFEQNGNGKLQKNPKKVGSISIMGKAGILTGDKGDIMLATAHVCEGTTDNYLFENDLLPQFFDGETNVYVGPMATVLGTSLQNRDVLEMFKSDWNAVGLEMEGGHYQKAINASIIKGNIPAETCTRYAYYASDNPLMTGNTLAAGAMGQEGIKPTYMITKVIVKKILSNVVKSVETNI